MAENIVVNTTNNNVVINKDNPNNPFVNASVYVSENTEFGYKNLNITQSGNSNTTNTITNLFISDKNARTVIVSDPGSFAKENLNVTVKSNVGLLGINTGPVVIEKTVYIREDPSATPAPSAILIGPISNGRITLQSNNPVYYTDVVGSTIYYTPYEGNNISLYSSGTQEWKITKFNELSLSVTGITSNTNYDIFVYKNNNAIELEKCQWTSNNIRSTALIYQDGILVKSGEIEKRYLGTIRSNSSGLIEDSSSRRFVYNHNNRITKSVVATDSTSHTYTSSTTRAYRNVTTAGLTRAEFINGSSNAVIPVTCNSFFATETGSSSVGVSLNSTSVFNTKAKNTTVVSSGPALIFDNNATDYISVSSGGYNYLQMVQYGGNVSTFYNANLLGLISC